MNTINRLICWMILGTVLVMSLSSCNTSEQSQSLEEKKDSVITELIEDAPANETMGTMPVVPELIGSWDLVAIMAGNTPTQVEKTVYNFSPDGELTITTGDSEPLSAMYTYRNDTIRSEILPSDVRIQTLSQDSLAFRVVIDQSHIDITFTKQPGS